METLGYQFVVKKNRGGFTFREVESSVLWSMTLRTISITPPLPSPPGFWAAVNFEMVIPSLASAASLVRMRSRVLSLQRGDDVREENKEEGRHGLTVP